jgi:hypothetical protein
MTKPLFFIFLFLCSLQSFSQRIRLNVKSDFYIIENKIAVNADNFECTPINRFTIETEKVIREKKVASTVFDNQVCPFFSARMLKRFTAQV